MGLRYVIKTRHPNGGYDSSVEEIPGDEFLIGRGSDCQIRFNNRLVSMRHARLVISHRRLIINDLNSLGGTQVNSELVRENILKNGDVIRIGNIRLKVSGKNEDWTLTEHREETEKGSKLAGEEIDVESQKLRITRILPSQAFLSTLVGALIAVPFLIAPLVGFNQSSWNSGPISNAHKIIAQDCAACHPNSFERVADQECLACHNMTDHHEVLPEMASAGKRVEGRCATCHMEHNGDDGLIPEHNSRLCTACHDNISGFHAKAVTKSVPSISEHPEFAVRDLYLDVYGSELDIEWPPVVKKISLADKANLSDGTQIKLNHQIHLEEDIAGPGGERVTLDCASCHELSDDLKQTKPINFERHCEGCHSLEFDTKLPGVNVPHGEPDEVFRFIYREYAKLFLARDGEFPIVPTARQRPGGKITRAEKMEYTREAVAKESRKTEQELFTKTGCHLCHYISDSSIPEDELSEKRSSKYLVNHPSIPKRWLPAARFDHGAHEFLDCQECHRGVDKSTETKDVLLPLVADCTRCHLEESAGHYVRSDCITCHTFHDSQRLASNKKRLADSLSDVLKSN